MHRKLLALTALLMIPTICTSCQLMPVEEELPAAPVIRAYEAKEYKLTTVMRGDIALTEIVTCTYNPANRESLAFVIGGELIKNMYAEKGDVVTAGTLLAELESGNLQEQIYTKEYELERLKTQLTFVQNELMKETAVNEMLRDDVPEKEDSDDRLVKLALQLEEAEDAVYIKECELKESRKDLSERQIRAGIDGTVTYVRTFTEGQKSEKDKLVYTVADMSTSVFTVEGEKAEYFPVGAEVTITHKGKEYQAVVVAPEKLNVQINPEKKKAYLELKQPDPSLESGATAKVTVTHESREDVLFLNKKAVKSANGENFVYMLGEDGLRYMQYVTTGLVTKEYIEIISGLSEGDSVVLE